MLVSVMLTAGSDTPAIRRTEEAPSERCFARARGVGSYMAVWAHPRVRRGTAPGRAEAESVSELGPPSGVGAASYVAVIHRQRILPPCGRRLMCSLTVFGAPMAKGEAAMTVTTLARVSVSVWLPTAAHAVLGAVAADEGVSLPVLARRAAACAVASVDGRVRMPSPAVEVVAELRAAGHDLNRLLPALGAVTTVVQERAVTERVRMALERIANASVGVQLHPSSDAAKVVQLSDIDAPGRRWRLVRVTTDPGIARCWELAAGAAGFRSTANWVRDALAGTHNLAVARPPMPVTVQARAVIGRVLGLLAQTAAVIAARPYLGPVLGGPAEQADAGLWAGLQSLLDHGGQPQARW